MAEQQLLSQQNSEPNGCIVAAVTGTANQPNHNAICTKLKNCSNGDVNGTNLINLKNGSTKIIADLNISETPSCEPPPDGGARAWCVMISAFFCNSIIFGIVNTYGTVYIKVFEYLVETGDPEAASKASLVGSLTIGTTFLLSPVSGILTDKIGLKTTTFIGGVLMTVGMILSSQLYHNIYLLYLTYGVMFGLGAALAYTPTIAILGHYFKRYLGLVSGFVTSGSSIFTIILPKVLQWLLDNYGLQTTCIVLGTSTIVVILCSLVYKPRLLPPPPPKRKPGQSSMSTAKMHLKSLVHVDNFKRKRYIVWALSMPIALLGYFVPYVHVPNYVEKTFPDSDKNLPIMCIGLTSGLGRLFFGYIADYKCVNRIFLQQMSFILMGLFTIAIPFVDSFNLVLVIALGMGVVDGCFISVLGPVAYDLCGAKGATQAIGFLLGLCSIPITAGAPIAGFLYDETKSYRTSFIVAGIPALIGASLMTFIHFIRDERRAEVCDKQAEDQIHKLLNKPAWTEDIAIDIKEKNCNTYTFQKMLNGQPKAVLTPETTEFQIDGQDTKL
ncbi:monocarboxylate transporter 10 isoform X2 [Sitodiplosis mosellana]|uniref:monocarboxylate transporter 10 isoform X2 n=1 Tax=Sitodiplosis mosellana TaxID=263140 RepID=UPI002444145A|nr:monocarboxylate transporter 10 isoform X2 [Sitodiplosis mosellana]